MVAASLSAQTPASYAEFGVGCNGDPALTPFALNAAAPSLTVGSLPNEYAYPVINTNAAPVQVLGFEVFTRANNALATAVTGNAGIFRDNSGAGALVHTIPANTGVAHGTIEVTGTARWYSVAVTPPVVVQPGEAFWVQLDAYSVIAPPQNATGGTAAPASIYYRRPSNGMVWTLSVSVARPIVQVRAATLSNNVSTLTHATLPVQGQTPTVNLFGPANYPAVMVLAFSDQTWLGLPLPMDLGFVGAPNCTTFTSVDQFDVLFLDGAGVGTWSALVPTDAAFTGLHFFNQGGVLGASNQLGVYMTNAGRGIVGS